MNFSEIIDRVADGHDLSAAECSFAFTALMDGKLTPAQSAAFLIALRVKGESTLEMATAAEVCLSRCIRVSGIQGEYLDIVGTGGDGKHSFNCSTCAALVMAGLGYQIVKHGNRAVSSASGAADVLESLGYPLDLAPDGIKKSLKKSGFAFCMAPNFHPGFKNVVPIRKQLGVRTLFNLMGPMINPSRPTHLMMGVAKPEMVKPIAQVLSYGTYKRALVIHGAGGYDEGTAFGPVSAVLIEGGELKDFSFTPADYGFIAPASEQELCVETPEEAHQAVLDVLQGKGNRAMSDMVAINVALALNLMVPELDMQACVSRARMAVALGVGMKPVVHF